MILSTRKVKSIWQVVQDRLGEPTRPLSAVFPLSPSAVVWGQEKGCTLKRVLQKCYGIRTKMPVYVQTGSLVDHAIMTLLQANIDGKEFDPKVIEESIFEHYVETRGDFHALEDEQSYLEWVLGYVMGVIERNNLEFFAPLSVQHKVWLYIGDGVRPGFDKPVPVEVSTPEGSETITYADNWVLGYLDWIEDSPMGEVVVDLKVTSRPTKSANSGVGKYKTAMMTYAAAREQQGKNVHEVKLYQLQPKRPGAAAVEVSEIYTEHDYDRTVQRYRSVRDHYLGVAEGSCDLIVPPRGYGECSERNCSLWSSCPMGGLGFEV